MRAQGGVVAITIALLVSGCAAGLPQSGDESSTGSVTLFDLELGDCLNDADIPLRSDMTDAPRTNCDEPHDSELFAILGVEGSAFPGESELVAQGQSRCAQAFGDFVGIPSEKGTRTDFGVVSDVIYNEGRVFYEVTFFEGDSEIFTSDRVFVLPKGEAHGQKI